MASRESGKQETKGRTLADVRALARILRQYDLTEVEVELGEARVMLRRELSAPATPPAGHAPAAAQPAAPADSPAEPAAETLDDAHLVTSPFVGTFYRAPGPEAEPFAEPGQSVKKGQVLCIVEAMKLMNEIEAEVDAKIVEVLVNNGEPVEYGQALFKIEPA